MAGQHTVLWYQDESVFYAHDHHKRIWTHKLATAKPYAKDYGWLRSPDRSESAQVLFRTQWAMDILKKHYPDEEHILIFDNATTHQKRPEYAISASKMTKGPSENFFVEVPVKDPITGKQIYGPDGKKLKQKAQMSSGRFHDGTEQEFYFPTRHHLAGQFKGMVRILQERGYDMTGRKAQCGKKFGDCPEGATQCCCQRTLYNEPDFADVVSALEEDCTARGFSILFLPKFHCELNFIEQCWGHVKRRYRTLPPSSREDTLQKTVIMALDEIPLLTMRRFSTRACRFMDAYRRGLNGRQAAWVARKFRGHRTIPVALLQQFDRELEVLT
ncbi:hypothetical protein P691DRAFT_779685 [Macrolepiota fuliginosa MF-IS2]|uniref:Tc1-like transposase DDE domain-containing protein n=1 Tax=Macrolepiota fuliginosa MF-IS2 TaxID=1400762 RepID=A0A9P6BXJ1_9AGAR|nr:hypothetical protein P691DRAFT_779685 [Macrolepiota fuliginosa MF-IS2]